MEDEIETPIVAGAQYEDVDGETVRVKSVWVDEDCNTQVQIFYERSDNAILSLALPTVSLEDFVSRIGPTGLERSNTDHEAWEWRQE